MASDISLAVGDGARRMTYAELAAVRGISALSAERLVRRKHWPRQVGNDGIVHVLVPLTEARKVSGSRRVSSAGHHDVVAARTSAPDIREVLREVIREALAVSSPDDGEDIRTLQCVLEERDRTIADLRESIRDLRARLDASEAERRRLSERLQGVLTHRQSGSVPSVPAPRVPWWRRWFR
jgi:hypothetical protein